MDRDLPKELAKDLSKDEAKDEVAVRHTFLFRLIAEETQRKELEKQRIKRLHNQKLAQGHSTPESETIPSDLCAQWAASLSATPPAPKDAVPHAQKSQPVWHRVLLRIRPRTRHNEWQRLT